MHTEDAIINGRGKSKIVEDLSAVAPDIQGAILSETFIVETINLRDLTAFVVPADEGDAVRVSDLRGMIAAAGKVIFTFRARRRRKVSTLLKPRSTKSPRKR